MYCIVIFIRLLPFFFKPKSGVAEELPPQNIINTKRVTNQKEGGGTKPSKKM
jgi:hypothetical protein